MKQRKWPQAVISAKGERSVQGGHPWIYDTEVRSLSGEVPNGSLVDAVSEKGKYLGTGFYSETSKIRIRLIPRSATAGIVNSLFSILPPPRLKKGPICKAPFLFSYFLVMTG